MTTTIPSKKVMARVTFSEKKKKSIENLYFFNFIMGSIVVYTCILPTVSASS